MKRILYLIICMSILFATVACGSSDSEDTTSADTVSISYWIPVGEDSTYYMSYEENPGVKYLESLEYNGNKIDLSFMVPLSGSERDNFNTLLATEEYADLIDMAFSTTSATELLEDEVIYDLTPYMEDYMPNYMALLEKHPELKAYTYANVDGERRILQLYSITEEILGNFMGFLYRRDWVAKYGTHPTTGESFTYGFTDPNDKSTWEDNVVFPSGESEPVYISDWEWMFEIFNKAMADLGINDGYSFSPYFKGYNEDGALFSGFGGGTPLWYKDENGNAAFGGDSDSMRAYLQALNNWYEKGWLDKSFAEHTNDQVYAINTDLVHTGKVGMWIGRRAETGTQMDTGSEFTSGIVAYGARQPINDIYGSAEQQNKEPNSLYQYSRLRGSLVVSRKVAEEDLPTVLSFLDSLFTAEGGAILCFGLNKEQFEMTQDPTYIKYGLTEGAYQTEVLSDGSIKYNRDDSLLADNNLASAMAAKRMTIGYYAQGFVPALNASYIGYAQEAMARWDYYENQGYIERAVQTQFTTDESNTYNKVYANIDTFMASNIPQFITGKLDIDNDQDWEDYVTVLNKYSPEKVTQIFQRIFDSMK